MGRRRHTGKQPHEHNLVKSRWKWTFFLVRMGQHLIPLRNIIDFPKLPKITGTACQDLTESGSETKVRIWDRKTDGFLGWQLMTWHSSNRFLCLCHVFSTLKGRYHNGATQMMLLWNDQGWIWRARWSAWVDYWRFYTILYFGGYRDAFHTKKYQHRRSADFAQQSPLGRQYSISVCFLIGRYTFLANTSSSGTTLC